jgi:hypothetical protein
MSVVAVNIVKYAGLSMRQSMKNKDNRQQSMLDLFSDTPTYVVPQAENDHYLYLSYRDSLIYQIRRDLDTLKMDPVHIGELREFYENRIKMYRQVLEDADRFE